LHRNAICHYCTDDHGQFLPFSQTFEAGFIAYRLPEFADFFAQRYVSLELKKGDAVFFNPALFHAAGANATQSFHRVGNLLQVSSPFGKPMETIRTLPILERCWEVLSRRHAAEGFSAGVDAFVAAVAEGYPFPTNLDARPPGPDGMAPESEQEVVRRALSSGWDVVKMKEEVAAMRHG
jgi:ectoine hydroxylase-related dioxygenase (phytanoyl-CoA dioxygenase family)